MNNKKNWSFEEAMKIYRNARGEDMWMITWIDVPYFDGQKIHNSLVLDSNRLYQKCFFNHVHSPQTPFPCRWELWNGIGVMECYIVVVDQYLMGLNKTMLITNNQLIHPCGPTISCTNPTYWHLKKGNITSKSFRSNFFSN